MSDETKLSPKVLAFARAMQRRIDANAHHGNWRDKLYERLCSRLMHNVTGVFGFTGLPVTSPLRVDEAAKLTLDAVDAANYLLFILDQRGLVDALEPVPLREVGRTTFDDGVTIVGYEIGERWNARTADTPAPLEPVTRAPPIAFRVALWREGADRIGITRSGERAPWLAVIVRGDPSKPWILRRVTPRGTPYPASVPFTLDDSSFGSSGLSALERTIAICLEVREVTLTWGLDK